MIVFVEGADGAGKSTLVKQLSEHYPTITVSRTVDNRKIWDQLKDASSKFDLVTDRCPLSDYVYRLLDNEKGIYSITYLLSLFKYNKIIYCRTSTQWEDAMARGEDNITNPADAAIIDRTYNFLMQLLKKEGIEVIEYNWRKDSVDELLAKLKQGGQKYEPNAI